MGYASVIEHFLLQTAPDGAAQLLADTELLCRTIMDCTLLGDAITGEPLHGFWTEMEAFIRNLRFDLHLKSSKNSNEAS